MFEKTGSPALQLRKLEYIKKGLSEGISATKMYKDTIGTELGYKKTDFLYDVRLASVGSRAQSVEAFGNVQRWFDKHIEPFRIKTGLTGDKALEVFQNARLGRPVPEEYEESAREFIEEWEADPSP